MVIDNPVFGSMRNSIGGITFYSGKSGQTARVRNSLLNNSNTYAKNAKYAFSSISKSWKSLPTIYKTPFITFADLGFVPLKRTNTGQYSGYQCYMSLQQTFQKCINNVVPSEWFWGAQTLSNPPTSFNPTPPTNPPPNGTVIFSVADVLGGSIPLGVSEIHFDANKVLVINLYRYVSSVPAVSVAFLSSTGANYVIGAYCSEELSSINSVPKHPWQKYLGNCEFGVGNATANWYDFAILRLQLDLSTNINRMKYPIRTGKSTQITLICADEYGSCQVLYKQVVTLS